MQIKIVQRPIGEAPDWVRDAWIGLTLPMAAKSQRRWIGLGVLSGPTNAFAQIWAVVRGKSFAMDGYSVNARTAVDLLAAANPEAARWWRKNTPKLLLGSRCFVFDAAACEILPPKT